MEKEAHQLHAFFFPYMAQGHMIPNINMAKLFNSRGLKATIVTTSYFLQSLSEKLEKSGVFGGAQTEVLVVKIPCLEAGLPEGTESFHMAATPDMQRKFLKACWMLRPQLDRLLERHRPDCLVADVVFPWANDVAAKFGIPSLVFHATSYFTLCAGVSVLLHEPHNKVSSDSEPFIIPNLPDEIEFTRSKVPDFVKHNEGNEDSKLSDETKNLEQRSYGVLVNSFYELEPAYADHCSKVFGWKAWHIGPLFLYENREVEASIEKHECLRWLDSKKPNSVIYVSFGSMANFDDDQLMEIATGLEISGQQFVWVVKKEKQEGVREEWLPQGFEKRIEGKGLIIRGWAPQVRILEHEAVGGFVTHCGWNSTLESVCAGVPMVTWPVAADQFYNEKLVTQILGIGVEVGAKKWKRMVGDFVKREAVEKAVRKLMEGEEAEEMRTRVRGLAEMARRAVEQGGSSMLDLTALFEDLKLQRIARHST